MKAFFSSLLYKHAAFGYHFIVLKANAFGFYNKRVRLWDRLRENNKTEIR